MRTIVYYVSGHGFGHARRTAEILRSLTFRRSDVRVIVRTTAPAHIFRDIPNVNVSAPAACIDAGVVERDTLTIDPAASLRRLDEVLGARDGIEREAEFVRLHRPKFVVADIPFLAGDVAQAAGVPCVGVGNFTWDWIYEPLARTPHDHDLVRRVRQSYEKFESLLHLPLGHEVCCFRKVVEFPLVASHPRRPRDEVFRRLGIAPDDPRPRVLVAMRGGVKQEALAAAARGSPQLLFLLPVPSSVQAPKNMLGIDANSGDLDFSDLLSVCSIVVSKVGYGILADCIAAKVALLHPRREGFREDDVSLRECPRYLRMRELPREGFFSGNWDAHLCALLAQPAAGETLPTDGDRVVAAALSERLG